MVGIKSDAGNVRELNEDYASFIEDERFKIYLVADGMGGHNAGEIASKLAVKSIIRYLLEHSEEDENLLLNAVKYANNEIYEMEDYSSLESLAEIEFEDKDLSEYIIEELGNIPSRLYNRVDLPCSIESALKEQSGRSNCKAY